MYVLFLSSMQALKKTFKKLDHDVIVEDFFGGRYALFLTDSIIRNVCFVARVHCKAKILNLFPYLLFCSTQTIEVGISIHCSFDSYKL